MNERHESLYCVYELRTNETAKSNFRLNGKSLCADINTLRGKNVYTS